VPVSAFLATNSIPESFKAKHKDITVHGLLASFLAFGGEQISRFDPWKATWPTLQDFQVSMPILWPQHLRGPFDGRGEHSSMVGFEEQPTFILPPAINGRWTNEHMMKDFWHPRDSIALFKQEQKLSADWEIVSKLFPGQTKPEYTYYWLIVNTRSFYFDLLGEEKLDNHDDRMVMCPFVDYFNHADHGVSLPQAVA
jgi:hypothetical protein